MLEGESVNPRAYDRSDRQGEARKRQAVSASFMSNLDHGVFHSFHLHTFSWEILSSCCRLLNEKRGLITVSYPKPKIRGMIQ